MQQKINSATLISFAIILLGMVVRIIVYFQNRSLIIDEANLARNIIEKDYLGFFKPLDYEQYAPPLFAMLSKFNVHLLGVNEYALKAIPLLAGIASLFLLWRLIRLLIKEKPARWYVLFLFAFSILAVRYSTEFKQYALDVALVLLFTLWTLNIKDRKFNLNLTLQLMLAGAVAVWLSMPIIFILSAMGIVFCYQAFKLKNIHFTSLLAMGGSWLLSFGIYYFSILHVDATSDYLQNYHRQYFFNFFPTDWASLENNSQLFIRFFRSATDATAISIVFSILNFMVGMFFLIQSKKVEALLLLLPLMFCLIASHLGLYSLIPRLTLFVLPFIMLIIGIGLSVLWGKSNVYFKGLLTVFIVLSCVNKKGYEFLWKKMEIEDSKSGMTYLNENRKQEELIYIHHLGAPAFLFYNEMHDKAWNFKNYHIATWNEQPNKSIPPLLNAETNTKSRKDFYLFFSHTYPQSEVDKATQSCDKIATKVTDFKAVETIVPKYQLK